MLPTLVPCKRWREPKKNLKPGDLVMMSYPNQLKNDYRIARVLEVFPDDKNLVRTVRVTYRRRDKKESRDVFWKKPLVEETVAVQRLSILQAAGEALPTGTCMDDLPLDHGPLEKEIRAAFVKMNTLDKMVLFV